MLIGKDSSVNVHQSDLTIGPIQFSYIVSQRMVEGEPRHWRDGVRQ